MPPLVAAVRGDIWDLHAAGAHLVDPTNLVVGPDGRNVMGAGLSRQVAARYPDLAARYGAEIMTRLRPGSRPGGPIELAMLQSPLLTAMEAERILLVPVKLHWRQPARLDLIERGLVELGDYLASQPAARLAVPRLGCGRGGLDWRTQVRPLFVTFVRALPDQAAERLTIVAPPGAV